MSRIWFTADTHFGHANIIKFQHRPFLSPEDQAVLEANGGVWHYGDTKGPSASPHKISRDSLDLMHKELIHQINAHVRPEDTLWHLGDVGFFSHRVPFEGAWGALAAIRCRNMHLVWGNHDDRKITDPHHRGIADYFQSVQDLAEIAVKNQKIVLCHYAMATWNKSHRGSWHLYGHSHAQAEEKLDNALPGRRSMDVGVDNAYRLLGVFRPFSFEEIRDFLKDRAGSAIDHHVSLETPTEEELFCVQ
jgi:calcineurin-like phosphoesterase family protein